ncbi:uncharacterized protein BDZ99DRAFT_184866 [Mytilinidion resinicola]|uniref:Uncharacterized protein n=1 Tax=Mytilinidion resinicola TaxID=574789 RepID=A0A6A6Z0V7_9PEZI|nr:uncharacterized protein BDZ99DRAFT_184866 [Mytilinidion resinicola]KAF2814796.1 hypothetical protein BDZ99DRAFT_184866 [Mytilinidion resinicola]
MRCMKEMDSRSRRGSRDLKKQGWPRSLSFCLCCPDRCKCRSTHKSPFQCSQAPWSEALNCLSGCTRSTPTTWNCQLPIHQQASAPALPLWSHAGVLQKDPKVLHKKSVRWPRPALGQLGQSGQHRQAAKHPTLCHIDLRSIVRTSKVPSNGTSVSDTRPLPLTCRMRRPKAPAASKRTMKSSKVPFHPAADECSANSAIVLYLGAKVQVGATINLSVVEDVVALPSRIETLAYDSLATTHLLLELFTVGIP